ncbi:MAG: hypothetical protein ACRDBX_00195 [Erysipelotrichaceae bacterium]
MNRGSLSLIALLYLQVLMAMTLVLSHMVQSSFLSARTQSLPMLELALLRYIRQAYDDFEDEDHTTRLLDVEIALDFDGERCVAFFEWEGESARMDIFFDFECNCIMESTISFSSDEGL